jgi:hypothetical protein
LCYAIEDKQLNFFKAPVCTRKMYFNGIPGRSKPMFSIWP